MRSRRQKMDYCKFESKSGSGRKSRSGSGSRSASGSRAWDPYAQRTSRVGATSGSKSWSGSRAGYPLTRAMSVCPYRPITWCGIVAQKGVFTGRSATTTNRLGIPRGHHGRG